jgi:hypothetical protein
LKDFAVEIKTSNRFNYRAIAAYAVFLAVAALMSYYYAKLRWMMNGEYGPGALEVLLEGAADKPFQYRVLVPWLVGIIGEAKLTTLEAWLSVKSVFDWFRVVETISIFFLIVTFRYYIAQFLGSATITFIVPFFLFYALPFNFLWPPSNMPVEFPLYLPALLYFPNCVSLYYPYDTPSMMFFTLGMVLIYKKRWPLFYVLFAIATVNRETTCFLTFIYFFTALGSEKRGVIAVHCGAQLVIWAAIKYMLHLKFASNPGEISQSGIFVNLEILSDPSIYYYVFSNMGFLWLPTFLLWRKIRVDFVRRSLLVAVPFLLGNLFVGQYTEIRGFGELIPVVVSAFVLELQVLFGRRAKNKAHAF